MRVKQGTGQRRREKTAKRAGKAQARPGASYAPAGIASDGRHPHRQLRASGLYTTLADALRARGPRVEHWFQALEAVGLDKPTFADLAKGYRSAWALARGVLWTARDGAETLTGKAVYATLLWRDFLPERPSMEHIDDLLEEGSIHLERGDRDEGLRAWVRFWDALRAAAPPTPSRRELDGFLMNLKVDDWYEVFAEEALSCIREEGLARDVEHVRREFLARSP